MEKCTTECGNECKQVVVNMGCCNGGGTVTADITIGENGNWYINGVDTGVKAQGDKGDKGDQGEQGLQGEIGPQGPQGIQGAKGDKGDKGDAGETGAQGPAGATGVFSAMETIFDGRADTVGQTYNFTKPITDYKALVVETSLINPDYSLENYEWIFNPTASSADGQHRVLRGVHINEAGELVQNRIGWNFPTTNSVKINQVNIMTGLPSAFAITKIYGLK